MDFLLYLKAVFALAIVVGLILGLAVLVRKYAPELMSRLQKSPSKRRLELVETLVLDPTRRLVLVRVDQDERLMLLGEGAELFEPRKRKDAQDLGHSPLASAPAATVPSPEIVLDPPAAAPLAAKPLEAETPTQALRSLSSRVAAARASLDDPKPAPKPERDR